MAYNYGLQTSWSLPQLVSPGLSQAATEPKWNLWLLRKTGSLWPEAQGCHVYETALSDFWGTAWKRLVKEPVTDPGLTELTVSSWSFLAFCSRGEFMSVYNRIKRRVMRATWALKADRPGCESWLLAVAEFNLNTAEFQFLCLQSGNNKLNCRAIENITLDNMCNVSCGAYHNRSPIKSRYFVS